MPARRTSVIHRHLYVRTQVRLMKSVVTPLPNVPMETPQHWTNARTASVGTHQTQLGVIPTLIAMTAKFARQTPVVQTTPAPMRKLTVAVFRTSTATTETYVQRIPAIRCHIHAKVFWLITAVLNRVIAMTTMRVQPICASRTLVVTWKSKHAATPIPNVMTETAVPSTHVFQTPACTHLHRAVAAQRTRTAQTPTRAPQTRA